MLLLVGVRTRTALAAMALAAVLTMLAAACGGDGGGGTGTPAPSGSPAASQAADGATPRPTLGPGASALEKLSESYLAGAQGKTAYHVVNPGQHIDATWTVYRLGEKHREDWASEEAGFPTTEITIQTPGDDYVCTVVPSGTSCNTELETAVVGLRFRTKAVQEVPQAILQGLTGATVTDMPPETIAGKAASCFGLDVPGRTGEGPQGTEKIKICFADEGTLLYLKRTITFADGAPASELTVEAVEASAATQADFEPPVAPPPN